MSKFNFTKQLAAQDMICSLMKEKNLSAKESIDFSINREMCLRILETGYAGIALDLWGHAEPEREWEVLENPIIEIELDDDKKHLIDTIVKRENVTKLVAVCYFILYTMESLGYHI